MQERTFDEEGEAFGDQRRKKKSMMYNYFFVMRRIILVFAVFFMETPAFQIIILVFSCEFYVMYVAFAKPFKVKWFT
jgi:hypothetical protein